MAGARKKDGQRRKGTGTTPQTTSQDVPTWMGKKSSELTQEEREQILAGLAPIGTPIHPDPPWDPRTHPSQWDRWVASEWRKELQRLRPARRAAWHGGKPEDYYEDPKKS